jgi:hypothetical protein
MALKLNTNFMHSGHDDRPVPFLRKRVEQLEAELATLKGGDVGVTVNVSDTDGLNQRVNAFRKNLNGLFSVTSIKALAPGLEARKKEYESLHQLGEWRGKDGDYKQLMVADTRLRQLEQEATQLEEQIVWRNKGGKLHAQKFALIANSRKEAAGKEPRQADAMNRGLDDIEAAWWTEVRRLESRLHLIRG